MDREEKYLRQKFGNETPFRVPEGYFENFTAQMMEQLPERPAKTVTLSVSRWQKWRPYVAAASICAVIFGAGLFYNGHHSDATSSSTVAKTPNVESNLEQAADYIMIDNDDIYSYLADY